MAAQSIAAGEVDARPELFDKLTQRGVQVALVPLLAWDAVSVFLLAVACHFPWYVAWIPAISTSGIMLASSRIALQGTDPHVRAWAKNLAWFGLALGIVIAAVQHMLPDRIDPPLLVIGLIGGLPVAMGGCLWHIYCLAHASHERKLVQLADARQHAAEAEIAERKARAERDLANEAQRKLTAQRELAERVADAAGPRSVERTKTQPSPSGRKPSPLRDAAIAELIRRHRAGTDITTTVAAQLDDAIGASKGYCKKSLPDWIEHVLAHERGAA